MNEDTMSVASDALSAALMKIKLRALISVALDAGGNWGIDFPALDGFMLNVVQKGECWLSIEGHHEDVFLRAGDCFLMTGGKRFTLAKNLSAKKRSPVEQLFAEAQNGTLVCNGGGDFFAAGTVFRFEGLLPPVMFGRLPAVIHVAGYSDQAAVLRWSFERFVAELRGNGIGRSLILNHLAPIMLLQTLRVYLLSTTTDENWLVAISSPRLAKVFEAMHSDFIRPWSLDEFATLASMSRSGFASTFKKMVGVAPMDYLKNWRMQIACELLSAGNESLSSIASTVGYGSESAFSLAFNKTMGRRPGAYRREGETPSQGNMN